MTGKPPPKSENRTTLNEGRVLPIKQLKPPMPKVAPPRPASPPKSKDSR